ncbi:haloacid dehalogenase superfamily, subfamily IA, variant 1 with third motif having Dx(3-4)D or Dx(3-4)E [Halomicrobium zhouii]|uniref:Haloacid dehalogenase superfamily, subfamily IA, variant 1 with third motif having Dx(3-4)D or Dx(3-4)E n=1 Tax=Halomicrobium zhouii TaxID=767519 RepID=A0A1I6K2C0_9EURY|nr:HAD family hydrolase [Halomicrobium zhouii]SFR85327.1 haloacid dehalogenase superfamily, subfamily IA, variant 1 with third motif having Dx(3-4)D or Dx(3-4)E [Halomicrobium zhouii]
MTYDTVVFDNDGVLVGRTSFDVLREATQDTFEQFGVTDPDPDHVEDMTIGATPRQVNDICTTYDLHPDTFWRARDDTMSRAQQEEARAGRKTFYDDVDTLADLDAAMGIVSSNQQATVDFLLDHFDVGHHFGAAYGREATIESLDRRKPNSHYIDRALSDLDADSALFVGDNESDIRAAENAGIDSAFIRRPHRTDWELNVWPTWDIDCLDDLHQICSA